MTLTDVINTAAYESSIGRGLGSCRSLQGHYKGIRTQDSTTEAGGLVLVWLEVSEVAGGKHPNCLVVIRVQPHKQKAPPLH